jgi:hypothetical protein
MCSTFPAWEAILVRGYERHVVPIDDFRPHCEMPSCWCSPTDDDGVWVHHAMDRREFYENGEAKNG